MTDSSRSLVRASHCSIGASCRACGMLCLIFVRLPALCCLHWAKQHAGRLCCRQQSRPALSKAFGT